MTILNELSLIAKDYSILIVEDNKDLNSELVEITKLFFKNVDFAFDGAEGLEKFKSNSYDLVLSDITMPCVNGVELSREIKNFKRDQQIVILSAHQELKYLVDLIDIGINQFVAKPFQEKELLYRLLKVCENIFYKNEYSKMLEKNKNNKVILENRISKKITSKKTEPKIEIKTEEISKPTEEITVENINEVLSKHKMDASQFLDTMKHDSLIWNVMAEQVDELVELSNDFNEQIEKLYLNEVNLSILVEITIILRKMDIIFSFTDELASLGKVLLSLAEFLEKLDFNALDEEKKSKLKILEFIYDDISRFIETVFIYKDTVDVFYLEDSLNSSVEQLIINLTDKKIEEEEFELF